MEILDIPRSSVIRLVNRYQDIDTVENRPRNGHSRVFNQRDYRYLVQYVPRHRTPSASDLSCHLQGTFRRVLSTIRRRLHHADLHGRRPLRVSTLLPRHRSVRF